MRRCGRAADGDRARLAERTRAASDLRSVARARPRHDRQAVDARRALGKVGRWSFLELREAPGIAGIDDEPALALRNAVLELRLRDQLVSILAAVQVEERIRALGFSEEDARTLADHFLDAERRGKRGHGLARVEWLETLTGLDPSAEPECVIAEACYERWEGRGALGYLTLAAICAGQLEDPPEAARLVVAHDCFPTGMLGYWARRVARGGLLAVLTATSPPRLGS